MNEPRESQPMAAQASQVPRHNRTSGTRVYQRWPGNNLFPCGGRCVTGPAEDCPFRLAFALTITVPSVLFFGLESEKLFSIQPVLVLVPAGLLVLLWLCWFSTACIDPGILPREDPPDRSPNSISMEKELPNGQTVTLRWCYTCNIWRPPRASHCHECDNCVLEFDHHCPVLGTCIGARNIKFFLLTILFGYSLLMFVIVDTVLFFVLDGSGHSRVLGIVFVVLLGVVIGVPLTLFVGFHFVTLLCSGKTTREFLKHIDTPQRRRLFGWTPSRVRFRDFVDDAEKGKLVKKENGDDALAGVL